MSVSRDILILVVDDNKTMRQIITYFLRDLGFLNVVEAESGEHALQVLEHSAEVSLILSDWNMEPMDGLTFLNEVKKRKLYRNIPFIMITAESTRENVIAAAQAGVSNYIIKPFSSAKLKAKLEKVLGIID
jgi:two-component system chemotaxis response regulator CheY